MSVNKSILATLALIATFAASMAETQTLARRDVQPLRLKRVLQPIGDRYVPQDQDAVVILRITVGKDGVARSADPIGGFFTPAQAVGARQFVMKLFFEPLSVDGVPRASTGTIPVMSKLHRGDPPTLPALKTLLQDAGLRMAQQDWSGALAQLDAAISQVRLMRQYCTVEAMRSAAYEGSGSLFEALRHAMQATLLRDGVIATDTARYTLTDKALLLEALQGKIRVQKALGMYGEALDASAELQYVLKPGNSPGLDDDVSRIHNLIAGNELISTSMAIDDSGSVAVELVRPALSLVDLPAAAVNQAWVRCGRKDPSSWTYYEVPAGGKTWNRPDTADECILMIYGQIGTAFKLLQSRP